MQNLALRVRLTYVSAMKVADTDIIIIPGYENSGPDHWQSRWQQKLSTARRVEQDAWSKPVREDWVARVAGTVNKAEKPVLLVAHSLGIPTLIHAIPLFQGERSPAHFWSRRRTSPIRKSVQSI